MRCQPVSCIGIKNVIINIYKNKSPGCDLIRMSDLKLVADKVSPIIAKLVNLSVLHGKFPDQLKRNYSSPNPQKT